MALTKRAVVIGVDDYGDRFDPLPGARNDAKEIGELLKKNGEFELPDEHFLIGPDATWANIRAAISDVFWSTERACDIAVFYFAGHGRRDHFSGYLLPYDVDPKKPFVKGIRIQELKQLFLHPKPNATGIMILDCCYSGIATQIERAVGEDDPESIKNFHEELQDSGSGRFILASADASKKARERNCKHFPEEEEHPHGVYSFELLQALKSGEKNEYGQITLGALMRHLDTAFKNDPARQPPSPLAAGSGLDRIILTTVDEELQGRLRDRLGRVATYVAREQPTEWLSAVQILMEIQDQGITCDEIGEYLNKIKAQIDEAQISSRLLSWWLFHCHLISQKTDDSGWYRFLNEVLGDFQVDRICKLDAMKRNFLGRAIEAILDDERRGSAGQVSMVLSSGSAVQRISNEINTLDQRKKATSFNIGPSPSARTMA